MLTAAASSEINNLLKRMDAKFAVVANYNLIFDSSSSIFKMSTELKGLRISIYWSSYWNWQKRIFHLDSKTGRKAQMMLENWQSSRDTHFLTWEFA